MPLMTALTASYATVRYDTTY